jgi:hypothetical protein
MALPALASAAGAASGAVGGPGAADGSPHPLTHAPINAIAPMPNTLVMAAPSFPDAHASRTRRREQVGDSAPFRETVRDLRSMRGDEGSTMKIPTAVRS